MIYIFSIDNVSEHRSLSKFLHHMDKEKAIGRMSGNLVQCIGSYKGKLELSFIVSGSDYAAHIANSRWIKDQECVLEVTECNKQYATLIYGNGEKVGIGSLKSVDKDAALSQEAWTYRPDVDQYWISVAGNPDTVHE